MSVSKFLVVLDKDDKVYRPGETVTGSVKFELDGKMQFKGVALEITFNGIAACEWTELKQYRNNAGQTRSKEIKQESAETYLENKQIFIKETEIFELAAGEHSYPFAAKIPNNAPSSFISSFGNICYFINVNFDIPSKYHKEERINFAVINPLNLNVYPNLKIPYKNETSEISYLQCLSVFCCLCCFFVKDSLIMVVRLPKTAFAASESIPISLEITSNANDGNIDVNAINISLKREIIITKKSTKNEDETLHKLSLSERKAQSQYLWDGNLPIPSIMCPFLGNCSIMKIKHELQIEADVSGFLGKVNMNIPVTICDVLLGEDPDAPIVIPRCIMDEILTRGVSNTRPGKPDTSLGEDPYAPIVIPRRVMDEILTRGVPNTRPEPDTSVGLLDSFTMFTNATKGLVAKMSSHQPGTNKSKRNEFLSPPRRAVGRGDKWGVLSRRGGRAGSSSYLLPGP